MYGDIKQLAAAKKQARFKPINLSDDFLPRAAPTVFTAICQHGNPHYPFQTRLRKNIYVLAMFVLGYIIISSLLLVPNASLFWGIIIIIIISHDPLNCTIPLFVWKNYVYDWITILFCFRDNVWIELMVFVNTIRF